MPEDLSRVVWPRGGKIVERLPLARRVPTLAGKTIAFLWDHVFRGDEIFPIVERELAQRFRGVTFVPWSEFGAIYGGDERATIAALPDRLRARRVDAVVSAVGC